jgi:outer membrane receptor for ferrienterochelin and colicin
MKRLRLLLFALSILAPIILQAQTGKFTINGYVQDATSGEKLIGASVYDAISQQGTTSNEYGYYSLTLRAGQVSFGISFVGYTGFLEDLELKEDLEYIIELQPSIQLEEVSVTSHGPKEEVQSTQMGSIKLNSQQVKNIPTLFGENDLFKALQLMPGIQSGTEGTSGLYVRGGGPDQNLILLDGVPLYNADHIFGFFSVFNPDAVSNVNLIKGGYPARYGGRLSSVIDIRLKEGNMKEIKGSGSIGLISSRILLEGPIIRDKTSFMISARRTYIDVLARPIIKLVNNYSGTNGTAGAYFYDANLKINHKFSNKDRLYLSAFSGKDKGMIKNEYDYISDDSTYTEKSDMGLYWGNLTTALRWNHMYGKKLFSNVSILYSNYKFSIYEKYSSLINDNTLSEYKFEYFSGIEDISAVVDFDYHPSPSHEIKFGAKYIYHIFKPGVSAFSSTAASDSLDLEFGNDIINAHEYYVYFEDDIKLNSKLNMNLGLHYSAFMVDDEYYNSLQPRFSVRYLVSDNLSLKGAASKMQQYLHLLTNPTIGLPTDLWLPSTSTIPPQESWQFAVGGAYNLNDTWSITLEGFYKTMENSIEYSEGASYLQTSVGWEEKVDKGRGWTYGAEFLLRKDFGKFSGWLGYTLAWSNRLFPEQNAGQPFPYTYDRRHDIAFVAKYTINEKTDINVNWVYGTGKAVTLAVARYAPIQEKNAYEYYYSRWNEIGFYNGKNGFREPAYHRLDISLNRHKKKDWGSQTWSFGFYNVYNHQNPFYLYFGYDNNSRRLRQVSIFPIIPSVSYAFKF